MLSGIDAVGEFDVDVEVDACRDADVKVGGGIREVMVGLGVCVAKRIFGSGRDAVLMHVALGHIKLAIVLECVH